MQDNKEMEGVLTVTVALLLIHFFFDVAILSKIAMGIGVVGLIIPFFRKWISWVWFKLSEGIGFVISKVLLTVVFYLVLVPIALLSQLFTKGDLQLKKKKDTYYSERNHQYQPKDFENIW